MRAEEQIGETMKQYAMHPSATFSSARPIGFGMSNFQVSTHAALASQLMKPDANYTLHLKWKKTRQKNEVKHDFGAKLSIRINPKSSTNLKLTELF